MAQVTGPLRFIVKVVDAAAVRGGKAIQLCTEDGAPVGLQVSTMVEGEAGEMGSITVRFHIDGNLIRFADNDG